MNKYNDPTSKIYKEKLDEMKLKVNHETAKEIIKNIEPANVQILDKYELLKNHEFHLAWQYKSPIECKDNFYTNNAYYKFVSMKYKSMNYGLCGVNYYVENFVDDFNRNAVFSKLCNEQWAQPILLVTQYTELSMFGKKEKSIHKLEFKNTNFSDLDEFLQASEKNKYFQNDRQFILALYAYTQISKDIVYAFDEYQKLNNETMDLLKKEEQIYKLEMTNILSEMNKNMGNAKESVNNCVSYYKINPEYFLEKIKGLNGNEMESVVKGLLKIPEMKTNAEISNFIEAKFPGLIAETFRKGV